MKYLALLLICLPGCTAIPVETKLDCPDVKSAFVLAFRSDAGLRCPAAFCSRPDFEGINRDAREAASHYTFAQGLERAEAEATVREQNYDSKGNWPGGLVDHFLTRAQYLFATPSDEMKKYHDIVSRYGAHGVREEELEASFSCDPPCGTLRPPIAL